MLQINAVVLAVGLTGSYVWFRAVQAQQHEDRILPSSKLGRVRVDRPASATTSASPTLLPGSKSFLLTDPGTSANSSSATQPAVAPPATSKALFYGSKSAPVDLSPALQISGGNDEPPAILTNPTAATAPVTQPAP